MPNYKNGPNNEEKEKKLKEQVLREQPQRATVSCEICLSEIPKSLAHTEEVEDYVLYFCGLDCFDKWKHRDNADKMRPGST